MAHYDCPRCHNVTSGATLYRCRKCPLIFCHHCAAGFINTLCPNCKDYGLFSVITIGIIEFPRAQETRNLTSEPHHNTQPIILLSPDNDVPEIRRLVEVFKSTAPAPLQEWVAQSLETIIIDTLVSHGVMTFNSTEIYVEIVKAIVGAEHGKAYAIRWISERIWGDDNKLNLVLTDLDNKIWVPAKELGAKIR